ncbi:MAG: hypothetical protein JXQ29_09550, partial [Planctomycetes bacterium]|nr:hypothetical protein [Planctomycetota bacterium]
DRLTLRITRLDDAALLLEESEVLAGLSFDGLLAAHHEALDRILAAASPQSAVGRAAARLEALRAEEARDGARFAIVVHAGRDDRDLAPRLAAGLRAVPGVRADSVAPVRQDSAPLGDGGKQSLVEIRLRFQGASADLVAAVLEIVAGDGGTAEPPAAERPAVDFVATPRRLVVFVRPAPAGTGAVADESLEAAMSRGIDRLLERVGPGTGRGPSIAFAPAEVPAPAGRADERHAVLLQRLAKAAVSALAGKPAAAGVLPSPAAEPGRAAAAQVLVQPKLVKLGPRRLLSLAFLDAAGATPVVELGHVLAGADCTPSEPAGSGSSGRRRL